MKTLKLLLSLFFVGCFLIANSQDNKPWYKFSDDGTVCHIYKRDLPTPWFNRLSNNFLTAWVTQKGGIEVFMSDPTINGLTNPQEVSGNFWVRAGDNGKFTWINNPESEGEWECQTGMGYSRIVCTRDQVKSEVTYFIPQDDNVLLMQVNLTNLSSKERSLKVFGQVEWNLGDGNKYIIYRGDGRAGSQQNLYKRTTFSDNTIWAIQPDWQNVGLCRAWPYTGFLSANLPVKSHEAIRRLFLGDRLDFARPQEVADGKLSNTDFWSEDDFPWGVLQTEVTVKPNGEAVMTYILGMDYTKEGAARLIKKYSDQAVVDREFKRMNAFYSDLVSNNINSKTPDKANDRIVNIWTKYHWNQVIKRSENDKNIAGVGLWNYGIEGGNISVFPEHTTLPFNKTVNGQMIDYLLKCQTDNISLTEITASYPAMRYADIQKDPKDIKVGSQFKVPHHHDTYGYMYSILNYIKENGDKDFLNKEYPFIEGTTGTVWNHLDRAFKIALSGLSVNGLPRIPANVGDWMDEFTKVSQFGQAESVMFGMELCFWLKEYARIARLCGRDDLAAKWEKDYNYMKGAINETSWDGEWYAAVFADRNGKRTPVGSHLNKEGKIYLNSQSWAVLSGVADKERADKCLNAVESMAMSDYGPLVFSPSYTSYDEIVGTQSIYAPGFRNANVYPRPVGWAIIAAAMAGKDDLAWEMYTKASLSHQAKKMEVYQCEPYVYPENYVGPDHRLAGKGQFQWCLGEATSWMWIAYNYYLLGVRPEFEGLVIDPRMPREWNEYSVERPFRGDHYSILVKRNTKLSPGESKIRLDGKPVQGNLIIALKDGKTHQVNVEVGPALNK
jgi:cellobiose phosphorylase